MCKRKFVVLSLGTCLFNIPSLFAATATQVESQSLTQLQPPQSQQLSHVQQVQQQSFSQQLLTILGTEVKTHKDETHANVFHLVRQEGRPLIQTHITHTSFFELLDDSLTFQPSELAPIKPEVTGDQRSRIERGQQLVRDLGLNTTGRTVGQVKARLDAFVSRQDISDAEKGYAFNALRHMKHEGSWSIHPHLQAHYLGELAAEYGISKLIASIEEKPQTLERNAVLADAYFNLSQTYSHLCVYEGKVSWQGSSARLLGDEMLGFNRSWLTNKRGTFVDTSYDQLAMKRFDFLLTAIKLNPLHHGAWLRVLEYYFYEQSWQMHMSVPTKNKFADFIVPITTQSTLNQFSRFIALVEEIVQDKTYIFARTDAGTDGRGHFVQRIKSMRGTFLQTPQAKAALEKRRLERLAKQQDAQQTAQTEEHPERKRKTSENNTTVDETPSVASTPPAAKVQKALVPGTNIVFANLTQS